MSSHPRGAWRLANAAQLDPVLLWVSHIVVRHARSRPEVSFSPAYWFSVQPAVTRSREQALALARTIAEKAAREPQRFAELAREYSEDLPSRAEGGALGGVQASQLEPWPRVLDALAAIRPGQSSDVVETPYGFHVFYRSAPPVEETLSGAHIVIGHDQAQWLEVFARGKRPARSRDEALALATQISHMAQKEPARFAALVQQYSEHHDAVVEGDFGAWSTREAIDFPPRMKRLRELANGEVGAPIETHLGFEIIVRTPPRPRARYRARLAVIAIDKLDTESPRADTAASDRALERARALASTCSAGPACFDSSNAQQGEAEWEEGRRFATVSAALKRLRLDEITPTPVRSEDGFIIAQRLEPKGGQSTVWQTELPTPKEPDAVGFFGSLPAAEASGFLRAFAGHVAAELALSASSAETLQSLHSVRDQLSPELSRDEQLALFQRVQSATRKLLGEDLYAQYHAALNRAVVATVLGAPSDPSRDLGL